MQSNARLPIQERMARNTSPLSEIGCWAWVGGGKPDGYGAITYNGKCEGAHRVAYVLNKGEIPEGAYIRHSCDNKWCVNPDHLLAGTPQDNMDDKVSRGRQSKGLKHSISLKSSEKKRLSIKYGESHAGAKVSDAQVLEIAQMAANGETQRAIAAKFGLTQSGVHVVLKRHRRLQ